jgi:riboflavin transporter FmnP
MNHDLWKAISDNALYVLSFLGIIVVVFLIAYFVERALQRKNEGEKEKILATRKIAIIGIFSAIALILHLLRFPIPFIAPVFYEMDLGELPALIAAFAYGPVAGVLIVFIKILLKLLIQGTQTAFVGDLANFVISASFVLTAAIIYSYNKTKKIALIACVAATVMMTVFGTVFNAVYLIPVFAELFFGGNVGIIINMGSEVNRLIDSVWTLAIFAAAPFNLLKGVVISTATMLVYKKLRRFMK